MDNHRAQVDRPSGRSRPKGWVTATTAKNYKVQYRTTDGGASWCHSAHKPKVRVSPSVLGVPVPTAGAVPACLKFEGAIRSPRRTLLGFDEQTRNQFLLSDILLRSTDGGKKMDNSAYEDLVAPARAQASPPKHPTPDDRRAGISITGGETRFVL